MYKPNLKSISENVWKFYTEKHGIKVLITFSKRLFREHRFFNLNLSSVILYRFKHERYKTINKDIKDSKNAENKF